MVKEIYRVCGFALAAAREGDEIIVTFDIAAARSVDISAGDQRKFCT
jgi:hypothetical protein